MSFYLFDKFVFNMHCAARNFSECPPYLQIPYIHGREPPGAWTFIGSTLSALWTDWKASAQRPTLCGPPVRHVASDTEVLEVSSAAKDVEREALRIRHASRLQWPPLLPQREQDICSKKHHYHHNTIGRFGLKSPPYKEQKRHLYLI